ncbi:hypothetical protein [Neoaquamicrobium sediminum]
MHILLHIKRTTDFLGGVVSLANSPLRLTEAGGFGLPTCLYRPNL